MVQLLFEDFALGDVARNLREATQATSPEPRTILAYSPALFLVAPLLLRYLKLSLWLGALQILFRIEDREMVSYNLFMVVALDVVRPFVPAGHLTIRIEHEDRIVFHALHQQTKPFLVVPQRLLSPLALGNIPDDSEHETPVSIRIVDQPYGAQGQLYADLLAILPHSGKVQKRLRVDVGSVTRLSVAGNPRPVGCLQWFRNQRFDAQFEGL